MCHAVQGLGGTLGPDLTKSKVLDNKKGIQEILRLVKGPSSADNKIPTPKHLMPYQKDFTKKEAKSLWFWLRDMRQGSLAPYQPTYESSVEWQK